MKPPSLRRRTSKPSAVADSWSFLEQIDAPQWADLSLESSLMGIEGHDPWFDQSHRHHVISLREKQANDVKTNVSPCNPIGHAAQNSTRITNARERRKSGCKNKTVLQKVTSSLHGEDIYRPSTSDSSQSTHHSNVRSQNRYSTQSRIGHRTSVGSSFSKNGGRCSERSSNGCSPQDGSFGSKVLQLDGSKGSSHKELDDSFDASSDSNDLGKKTSGFSIGPARPKLRFSIQRRTSLLANSQALHVPPDKQSPGSSVLTDESTGSWDLEKEDVSNVDHDSQVRTGKLGIEGARVAKIVSKGFETGLRLLDEDSIGSKRNMLPGMQLTNRISRCEIRVRSKIADNKGFSVLSNRQVFPGKENKISRVASPAYFSTLRKNIIKVNSVRSSLKGSTPQPVVSLGENLSSAKSQCRSLKMTGDRSKRTGTRHSAVSHDDKMSKCEKDLEDIVAKHNQKIRTLQVDALRKQFR